RAPLQGQARRSAGDLLLLDGWPGVLAVHTVRQGRDGGFEAQATRGVEGAHQRRAESEAQDMRKKRNLFDELMEGFDALADQRAGKRTLWTPQAGKLGAGPGQAKRASGAGHSHRAALSRYRTASR